jgi:hypothetical protein
MSTIAIGSIINRAVAGLKKDESFVNVGVWNGFSFLAGLACNPEKVCVGIDNFSQFGGPRDAFLGRFAKYKSPVQHFFDMDYKQYFTEKQQSRIGFYIYDGEHSYHNQLEGLRVAEPFFSEDCIVLVDDTNWEEPRQATLDFVAQSSNRYEMVLDVRTAANRHPTFWNGVMILRRVAADREPTQYVPRNYSLGTQTELNGEVRPEGRQTMTGIILAENASPSEITATVESLGKQSKPCDEVVVVGPALVPDSKTPNNIKIIAASSDRTSSLKAGLDASSGEYVFFVEAGRVLEADEVDSALKVVDPQVTWLRDLQLSQQDILSVVPEGGSFILIDDDQWGAGKSIGNRRRFYVTEREGAYWGRPENDSVAIEELRRLRDEEDAAFLVVSADCLWWLECYPEMGRWLALNARPKLANERVSVFELVS